MFINFFSPDNNRQFYILLPVLLFIIVPGFVLQENYSDFSYLDAWFTIFFLISATLISIAVLFLFDWVLSPFKLSSYYGNIVRFLTYFLMWTGLLAPLSVESGMVDPANIPVDWNNFIISLVAASYLYIISRLKVKKYLAVALYCFLGINLVASLLAFHSLIRENNVLKKSIFSVSSTKNIFVISFDGLPRDATIEVLKEESKFKKLLDDFIIYQNVIASSPGTQASIFSELQGNRDFKQDYSTIKDFKNVDPSRLLTNFLDTNGFQVSTYGAYNKGFNEKNRAHRMRSLINFEREKVSEVLEFFDFTLVRIGSSHLVLRQENANVVKHYLTYLYSNRASIGTSNQWANHRGPKWDKLLIQTKSDYDVYVDRLSALTSIPSAHFLHFPYTHFPVDFTSSCEYKSNDLKWHSSHQDRDSAKKEIQCALLQFEVFVNKLKTLNIYDESLIVLKSDHGKPAQYNNSNRIESFKIRGHKYWGYSRYTPFLAIKGINHRSEQEYYDDNPVMLGDLAKTICMHAGIDMDCSQFTGYDVLQKNLAIPTNATSVIFIVNDSHSDFKFDSHESLHLLREKDFYNNIHRVLTDEILVSGINCHETILFTGAKRWNNGFSDRSSWVSWSDVNSSFIKFRPGPCKVKNITLDLQLDQGEKGSNIDFNIFIDGVRKDYIMEKNIMDGSAKEIRISVSFSMNSQRTKPVLIEVRSVRDYGDARLLIYAMRQN